MPVQHCANERSRVGNPATIFNLPSASASVRAGYQLSPNIWKQIFHTARLVGIFNPGGNMFEAAMRDCAIEEDCRRKEADALDREQGRLQSLARI